MRVRGFKCKVSGVMLTVSITLLLCSLAGINVFYNQFQLPIEQEETQCNSLQDVPFGQHRDDKPQPDSQLATTGKVWTAVKTFKYDGLNAREFVQQELGSGSFGKSLLTSSQGGICCAKWVVVTTIFKPSRTIQQLLDMKGWCVVIVGDKKTPVDLYQKLLAGYQGSAVFLTVEAQQQLPYSIANSIPWNHFGRKNLGYLYAVHHCAIDIYDCDDDNELMSTQVKTVSEFERFDEILHLNDKMSFFNPYANFVANKTSKNQASWPRGFPLSLIKSFQVEPKPEELKQLTASNRIALVQSLASIDPDMDAIYRLTSPLPLTFDQNRVPVVMSDRQYAPLNAQALMATRQSFFGLLLPISVHGRVTDIWRSYIWIRVLHDIDAGQVAFASPWVEHRRNEHSYDADFVAEYPLYTQTLAFVEFLDKLEFAPEASVAERLLSIYIACFEIGVVKRSDVDLVQAWLKDLHSVGYVFPEPKVQNKQLMFWNSDLHDGVRVDSPSVLLALGQKVANAGVMGQGGPYPEVLQHPNMIYPPLAGLIQTRAYHTMPNPLSEADVKQFHQDYIGNSVMQQTHAFVCSFVTSFCEAYMPMNKSLILLPAHRFTLGRCQQDRWERLIEHVEMIGKPRKNGPVHTVAAMGVYDAEYINYFTGIKPLLLPATSFMYTQRYRYYPRKTEILVGPLQLTSVPLADSFAQVTQLSKKEKWVFATGKQLYGRYSLQNIADHRAVVLLPYAVLSYGITELAAIGVPLFVPSIEFLIQLNVVNDRTILPGLPYCQLGPNMFQVKKHPLSKHPFSPEDESYEAKKYWFQFADFYQWKDVVQFASWEDLAHKLDTADFDQIHLNMIRSNVVRQKELFQNWRQVISNIDAQPREYPATYEDALKMWNVDRLMVD